eukprot:scaffold8596_cov63-Phaeocystis_antarctica.AAC.1
MASAGAESRPALDEQGDLFRQDGSQFFFQGHKGRQHLSWRYHVTLIAAGWRLRGKQEAALRLTKRGEGAQHEALHHLCRGGKGNRACGRCTGWGGSLTKVGQGFTLAAQVGVWRLPRCRAATATTEDGARTSFTVAHVLQQASFKSVANGRVTESAQTDRQTDRQP